MLPVIFGEEVVETANERVGEKFLVADLLGSKLALHQPLKRCVLATEIFIRDDARVNRDGVFRSGAITLFQKIQNRSRRLLAALRDIEGVEAPEVNQR